MLSKGEPNYVGGVCRLSTRKVYEVRLKDRFCACGSFKDLLIPCRYAQALCRAFKLNAEDYISQFYTQTKYRDTYSVPAYGEPARGSILRPISLDNLRPEEHTVHPPPKNRLRPSGRIPKKRRTRTQRTGHTKRIYHCSNCGSVHHRRNKCQEPKQHPNLPQSQPNSSGKRKNKKQEQQRVEQQEGDIDTDNSEFSSFSSFSSFHSAHITPNEDNGNNTDSELANDLFRTLSNTPEARRARRDHRIGSPSSPSSPFLQRHTKKPRTTSPDKNDEASDLPNLDELIRDHQQPFLRDQSLEPLTNRWDRLQEEIEIKEGKKPAVQKPDNLQSPQLPLRRHRQKSRFPYVPQKM